MIGAAHASYEIRGSFGSSSKNDDLGRLAGDSQQRRGFVAKSFYLEVSLRKQSDQIVTFFTTVVHEYDAQSPAPLLPRFS